MDYLTHLPLVPHIYISELGSIGSDNGLSPGWCQAMIWFQWNLKQNSYIFIQENHLDMSAKWWPFCPGGGGDGGGGGGGGDKLPQHISDK